MLNVNSFGYANRIQFASTQRTNHSDDPIQVERDYVARTKSALEKDVKALKVISPVIQPMILDGKGPMLTIGYENDVEKEKLVQLIRDKESQESRSGISLITEGFSGNAQNIAESLVSRWKSKPMRGQVDRNQSIGRYNGIEIAIYDVAELRRTLRGLRG